MNNYAVFLEGNNFLLDVEGVRKHFGFFVRSGLPLLLKWKLESWLLKLCGRIQFCQVRILILSSLRL
jgi:hypothetical protein